MKKIILAQLVVLLVSISVFAQDADVKYYKNKISPQTEDYVDKAPQKISGVFTINVPIEKVWSQLNDMEAWLVWYPNLKESKHVSSGKFGLGSERIAAIGNMKIYEEIIVWEENKAWGFTMLESNRKFFNELVEVLYLKKIDNSTTEITYKGGYAPRGMAKMMTGMLNKRFVNIWAGAFENMEAELNK